MLLLLKPIKFTYYFKGFGVLPIFITTSDSSQVGETAVFRVAEEGCNDGPCRTGFAIGTVASCGVSTVGGLVTVPALCTVGAVFTFGLSCAFGLAVTGISAGLCKGLPELGDQGETI